MKGEALLVGDEEFGVPSGTWVSFVRLATHRGVRRDPGPGDLPTAGAGGAR